MSDQEERIENGGLSPAFEEKETPKVDLNVASEEELSQLPGIGPALAARIVNYRREVHPFEHPAEIAAVPGITQGMYDMMAELVTIETSPGEPQPGGFEADPDMSAGSEPEFGRDEEAVPSEVDPETVEWLDASDAAEMDVEDASTWHEEELKSEGADATKLPAAGGGAEFDVEAASAWREELESEAAEGGEWQAAGGGAEIDAEEAFDWREEELESEALEVVEWLDGSAGAEFDIEESDDVDVEQELPLEEELEPPPEEGPPIIAYTAPPQGGHWGRLFFFSLLGAVAGAIMSLAFLLMVNGTLNFEMASSEALGTEASRLDGEIEGLALELSELRGRVDVLQDLAMRLEEAQIDMNELSRDLGSVQSEVEHLSGDMTRVQAELRTLSGEMDRTDENVSALTAQANAMSRQLSVLAGELDTMRIDADRFGAFLGGLRNLLDQPVAPRPEATAVWPVGSTPTPRPTAQPAITVIPLATPEP